MTTATRPSSAPHLMGDIREFHEKFDLSYVGPPRALPEAIREFRLKFLKEERSEYAAAVKDLKQLQDLGPGATDGDQGQRLTAQLLEEQLDALVDLVYVAVGTAYLQGFDFDEAWRRVHAANMRKTRAAPDGADSLRGNAADVVKPPGWRPPDLSDLVSEHAHRAPLPRAVVVKGGVGQ